jgi:hypothetical protein
VAQVATFSLVSLMLHAGSALGALAVLPTVGATAEGDDSLTTPFRTAPRVLQMYFNRTDAQAAFGTSPVSITGYQVRVNQRDSDGTLVDAPGPTWPPQDLNYGRYDVQLSDSSAAAFAGGELTSTTFANNMGPNVVTVRSGALTVPANSFLNDGSPGTSMATATPSSFGFLVTFATPYLYTPGTDLILTLRHDGAGSPAGIPIVSFDSVLFVDNRNDALAATDGADATVGGFFSTNVTQFTYTVVPEPGALSVLGIVGTMFLRRGRR